MRHATIAILATAVLLAVSPLRAQTSAPAAPPVENLTAARELVQVMKATDQFKQILPAILQGLKPAFVQGRPEVAKDFDAMTPIIINGALQRLNDFAERLAVVYASNFNVPELRDLIAFYHSPTGQKLIERQPMIARASMAAGQQFGQALVADLKQQITDELRKRGDAN